MRHTQGFMVDACETWVNVDCTMKAEIIIFPYDAASGDSLFHRLIAELDSGNWARLRVAVAFARVSGNYRELLASLLKFAASGRTISLTFGADKFGGNSGTDRRAIEELVTEFDPFPNARVNLYHEEGRTFHPKIYLFDHETDQRALLILGSSNWSYGGLADNVESSVILHLNLSAEEDRCIFDRLDFCFENYWSES